MFYYLSGTLVLKDSYFAVIDCGGVGYKVSTSLSTLRRLPEAGEQVKLYTHFYLREDVLELFGFSEESELSLFRQLISISGVGPKAAVALLSDMTVQEITVCILNGDVKPLTRVPGVGNKTAQRILLELRDKMSKQALDAGFAPSAPSAMPRPGDNLGEAAGALVVLGYSRTQAQKALEGLDAALDTGELVKQALKKLMRS